LSVIPAEGTASSRPAESARNPPGPRRTVAIDLRQRPRSSPPSRDPL